MTKILGIKIVWSVRSDVLAVWCAGWRMHCAYTALCVQCIVHIEVHLVSYLYIMNHRFCSGTWFFPRHQGYFFLDYCNYMMIFNIYSSFTLQIITT